MSLSLLIVSAVCAGLLVFLRIKIDVALIRALGPDAWAIRPAPRVWCLFRLGAVFRLIQRPSAAWRRLVVFPIYDRIKKLSKLRRRRGHLKNVTSQAYAGLVALRESMEMLAPVDRASCPSLVTRLYRPSKHRSLHEEYEKDLVATIEAHEKVFVAATQALDYTLTQREDYHNRLFKEEAKVVAAETEKVFRTLRELMDQLHDLRTALRDLKKSEKPVKPEKRA